MKNWKRAFVRIYSIANQKRLFLCFSFLISCGTVTKSLKKYEARSEGESVRKVCHAISGKRVLRSSAVEGQADGEKDGFVAAFGFDGSAVEFHDFL